MDERIGRIGADLRVGADVAGARALQANLNLCSVGMKTIGSAFQITHAQALQLGLGTVPSLEQHIRPYFSGRDFVSQTRGIWVVDFFGLEADTVRERFPAAYQHLLVNAKPEWDQNRNVVFQRLLWVIGHPRPQFRAAVQGQRRYVATVETAKHRVFAQVDAGIVPDSTLVTMALVDAMGLGVLSSQVHVEWALAAGGTLEDRPRYNKTTCFETFPFPSDDTGLTPELTERIRSLAEQLDAHRKARQAAHESVTLTGLYNVLDKLKREEPLSAKDKVLHEQGLVSVLRSLHDELDAAVLAAYGWSDLGPVPWADEAARAAWTESVLERLVVLNARRAAEEARGVVRWLRPEFQDPARRVAPSTEPSPEPVPQQTAIAGLPTSAEARAALDAAAAAEADSASEADAESTAVARPAVSITRQPWPAGLPEQMKAVAEVLQSAPEPLTEAALAERFTGRGPWKKRLPQILETLAALGRARVHEGLWLHS